MSTLPLWAEIVVGALALASGMFALLGALGLARLRSFFQRMHPTALVSVAATWCIALACVVYFSVTEQNLRLSYWLIVIMMSITVPITCSLIARAALFRKRQENAPGVPPPLRSQHTDFGPMN
jgi:multicomponent K+:H+ antiporter subunit G